jgi:hypothetical protein
MRAFGQELPLNLTIQLAIRLRLYLSIEPHNLK